MMGVFSATRWVISLVVSIRFLVMFLAASVVFCRALLPAAARFLTGVLCLSLLSIPALVSVVMQAVSRIIARVIVVMCLMACPSWLLPAADLGGAGFGGFWAHLYIYLWVLGFFFGLFYVFYLFWLE